MKLAVLAVGVFAVLGSASSAVAEVRLSIQRGHVTIVARDATVRQILAEWARVGQTRIVNAERIPGGPVTLELTDVPEQQALDVLLRAVSGYVVAPRATEVANASVFDRIVVMPTTVGPAPPVSAAPASTFAQPSQPPRRVFDDRDDDDAIPTAPGPNAGPNRSPVFAVPPPFGNPAQMTPPPIGPAGVNQPPPLGGTPQAVFPQPSPSPVRPPAAAYPGAPTSTTPGGVAVPGMIAPPPVPQPGQPVQFFPGQPQ